MPTPTIKAMSWDLSSQVEAKQIAPQHRGGAKKQPESLGSILFGDRIFNSPYDVRSPHLVLSFAIITHTKID